MAAKKRASSRPITCRMAEFGDKHLRRVSMAKSSGDTPKMPGEPPRVQPSKTVAANWDGDGNPVG